MKKPIIFSLHKNNNNAIKNIKNPPYIYKLYLTSYSLVLSILIGLKPYF